MVAKRSTKTNQSRKPEKEPQERELRRKKPVQSFKMYLYAVLKQVHPTVEISGKAMDTMNTFMFDIFERIVAEVARLVVKGNKQTLASRDMQFAVQLLLPGELAKHAISEGTKAVKKYNQSILTQD